MADETNETLVEEDVTVTESSDGTETVTVTDVFVPNPADQLGSVRTVNGGGGDQIHQVSPLFDVPPVNAQPAADPEPVTPSHVVPGAEGILTSQGANQPVPVDASIDHVFETRADGAAAADDPANHLQGRGDVIANAETVASTPANTPAFTPDESAPADSTQAEASTSDQSGTESADAAAVAAQAEADAVAAQEAADAEAARVQAEADAQAKADADAAQADADAKAAAEQAAADAAAAEAENTTTAPPANDAPAPSYGTVVSEETTTGDASSTPA